MHGKFCIMDNDFFASGFQALNSDSLEEIDIEAGFLAVDGHVPVLTMRWVQHEKTQYEKLAECWNRKCANADCGMATGHCKNQRANGSGSATTNGFSKIL